MISKRLLTRSEAAEYLGFCRRTLQVWDKQGVGPHVIRLPSGLPVYAAEDLNEFIDQHRVRKRVVSTAEHEAV
jgi:predicted site-specific integrase-resolvase